MSATITTLLTDPELLARLVSFDSTSRNSNLPLADMICDYLDRPGVRIERCPSPDGEKTNLVVQVGPEVDDARQGLLLSGHMDVVPAEEPAWESDPFTLVEKEDRYVGRGACDMKGFVALAVNLAARTAGTELRHPLTLVLTYDEEIGTLGAKQFAHTWPQDRPLPRRAIIGEPTSMQVVRLHKGHARARITMHGQSAHSGYPHLGRNAIEPAGDIINALAALRRALEGEVCPHREHFPAVPFVTLNLACIEGGKASNIVPDRCEIEIGYRVLPSMKAADLAERIERIVSEAAGDAAHTFELINESPPLELGAEAPIYRELCALVGQEQTVSASYATDAGWLQQLGLDCVLFGPGTIEVAHRPNESIPKDEMARAAELLVDMRDRCCLAA